MTPRKGRTEVKKTMPNLGGLLEGFTGNGARVKGWSPCGNFLYIGWAGVVPATSCSWVTDIASTKFARRYRPVSHNRWFEEAVAWGFAKKALS